MGTRIKQHPSLMLWSKPLDPTGEGEGVCIQVMSSDSKPRVRQNRHKQGLNQTREKLSADFRIYFFSCFLFIKIGIKECCCQTILLDVLACIVRTEPLIRIYFFVWIELAGISNECRKVAHQCV